MFDLSEVLISGLFGVEKELSPILGLPSAEILSQLGGQRLRRLCRGELTEEEYLDDIRKSEGWPTSNEQLQAAIRRNFHNIVEGMVGLAQELSLTYELVLFSDHAREWIDYIQTIHPFMSLFGIRVYSFETGFLKDEPSCFPSALATIGATPDKCVFIDDSYENVAQAQNAGIHGIQFVECPELRIELSIRGMLND